MAKTDRTVLISNDQQYGQVADPNKLEAMISHAYDIIDGNDTEFTNYQSGKNISRSRIALGAVGKDELDPTLWEQTAYEAKFGEMDEQLTKKAKKIWLDVTENGAIGDGISHPLSEKYSTLASAQIDYPHATSLTNEIDWAAIQGTINQALTQQKNIYVPSGKFIINQTLVIDRTNQPNRASIVGSGPDSTIIKYSGSGVCLNIIGNPSITNDEYASFQEISGLEFSNFAKTGTAISLKTLSFARLVNLRIGGFDLGLKLDGVEHSNFDSLTFRWNNKAIYATSTNLSLDTCPNNLVFISCHMGSNSMYGALFEYPTTVNWLGGSIENNGTDAGTTGAIANYGIKFINSGYQGGVACNLIGVYIESNAGAADVWFENTAWEASVNNSTVYSVVGCTFNKGTDSHYSLNNIRCTFAVESQSEKQKLSLLNSSFKAFNAYLPNASRKTILFDGVPIDENNFEQMGNIFAIEEEKPTTLNAFVKSKPLEWVAPTLLNGWVNFGGGYATVGYGKDELGFVHIKGMIKNGTTTAGTIIFTLPSGFRPSESFFEAVPSFGAFGSIQVTSSGDVMVSLANAGDLNLSLRPFKAEQ